LNPDGTWISQEAALRCAERNNAMLIRNSNQRVKPEDTVVCVGDFSCKGNERGIEGLSVKPSEILAGLNGKWVIIKGNHDDRNGVKSVCDFMSVRIENFNVGVQHRPLFDAKTYDYWTGLSKEEQEKMPWVKKLNPQELKRLTVHSEYCRQNFDFMICGHVHDLWHTKKISGIWHVNVGVDVNRYMPITDVEVSNIFRKAVKDGKNFPATY